MGDFAIIFAATGPWFAAAIGLEALALSADTAGNQRGGETEEHRARAPLNSLLLGAASLITPAVLMVYAWFALAQATFEDEGREFQVRAEAVALVIGAMIAGSIAGWLAGRFGPARLFRLASVPLALLACALALIISWPTLAEIADALAEGRAAFGVGAPPAQP